MKQQSKHSENFTEISKTNLLKETEEYIKINISKMLGYQIYYPCLNNFRFYDFLKKTYDVRLRVTNEVTDSMEKRVIQIFANLFNLKKDNIDGCIHNGSTASISHGIRNAKVKMLLDNPEAEVCLYGSDQSHFTIKNIARVIEIGYEEIPADSNGAFIPELLAQKIRNNIDKNPNHAPIICTVLGSTFKGAYDPTNKITDALESNGITNFYIHIDGAFGGGVLPFIKDNTHKIDFEQFHPRVVSISVSGHKSFGTPRPLGFYIVKKEFLDSIRQKWMEIGENIDNVFSQSERGAHGALEAWLTLSTFVKHGKMNYLQEYALKLAEALEMALKKITNRKVQRNLNSPTVVFEQPENTVEFDKIIDEYQLAPYKEKGKDFVHIIIMPNHKKHLLEMFLKDICPLYGYEGEPSLVFQMEEPELTDEKLDFSDEQTLKNYIESQVNRKENYSDPDFCLKKLGYEISEDMEVFINYNINSIGDVWETPHIKAETHDMEREALDYYATQFNFPENNQYIPGVSNKYIPTRQYWGYINSLTTCIMQGLLIARETIKAKKNEVGYQGTVNYFYYSDQTENMVSLQAKVLNLKCCEVKSLQTSSLTSQFPIDGDDLINKIIKNKDHYPIINLNYGSENGSIDNILEIELKLSNAKKTGVINDYLIHINGMSGVFFHQEKLNFSLLPETIKSISFRVPGATEPTGVILSRKTNNDNIKGVENENEIEYLKMKSHVLIGSRNGQQPLQAWLIQKKLFSELGFLEKFKHAQTFKKNALNILKSKGFNVQINNKMPFLYIKNLDAKKLSQFKLNKTNNGYYTIFINPNHSKEELDKILSHLLQAKA